MQGGLDNLATNILPVHGKLFRHCFGLLTSILATALWHGIQGFVIKQRNENNKW